MQIICESARDFVSTNESCICINWPCAISYSSSSADRTVLGLPAFLSRRALTRLPLGYAFRTERFTKRSPSASQGTLLDHLQHVNEVNTNAKLPGVRTRARAGRNVNLPPPSDMLRSSTLLYLTLDVLLLNFLISPRPPFQAPCRPRSTHRD